MLLFLLEQNSLSLPHVIPSLTYVLVYVIDHLSLFVY